MIVIIDLGMSNIYSVLKAFKRINIPVIVSSDKGDIEKADKLVLPGVGHFKKAMERINDLGIREILDKKVLVEKTPFLGICLGMQLLTEHSEEGDVEGLGYIKGKTIRLSLPENFKVPHIGWNTLNIKKQGKLFESLNNLDEFYFVHSYHVVCEDEADVLSTTEYGKEFISSISRGNIFATQFHPEKSHADGLEILKNFAEISNV